MLMQMNGSASSSQQYSMNSSVPKRFDSSDSQASSSLRGRSSRGPMPSTQC